ncbi:MAG: hypothetical protein QM703_13620 [Gemmatales bacterium]
MRFVALSMALLLASCSGKPTPSNPPVSVPGGGTLNAPPSDGIKVPGGK